MPPSRVFMNDQKLGSVQDYTDHETAALLDGPYEEPKPKKKQRLVSLDAVRGLTVCVMILVDNLGRWFPTINHSPWNHVTLADFVMPFFLFMVGCSMSLAFKKYKKGVFWKVVKRTIKLFILGILTQGSDFPSLGNAGVDLSTVRIPGILQRIAWAYFVCAMIVLYVPQRCKTPVYQFGINSLGYFRVFRIHAFQWIVAISFLVLYLGIMLGVTVPSWSYKMDNVTIHVPCHKNGDLSPGCSAARWVDQNLMTFAHMYPHGEFTRSHWCSSCSPSECKKPMFLPELVNNTRTSWPVSDSCVGDECAAPWCAARLDPEGTLSSMPGVLTTFIGYHFGMVLTHFESHHDRLMQWIPMSLVLLAAGLTVGEATWPANKQLWSPAYVLLMAGANGLFLTVFYSLLDYKNWQPNWLKAKWKPGLYINVCLTDTLRPFVWVGMNTIFIYLMSPSGGLWEAFEHYFYWKSPENNLQDYAYKHIFCDTDLDDKHGPCIGGMFKDHQQKYAQLLWILSRIAFWIAVAGVLHWRRWYWAL